eukprot:CAMPEP_0185726564 /NCGR_PEP_ID=MMETSP1171-20130828/2509_1 /TAXON_ID=374046 /ORGANISM="Helicotheca tamensis, Strain CCMP826" /LENGTH=214 /DNA_ID=CAMNT_0028394947 /DNA_START=253 /DNA_END=894 /DNA_ORIENTATION=+
MTVAIGDCAPDFSLADVDGFSHALAQHRGKKVMLSFYRFAACPLCNYAIDELKGRYKKLAWAANLDVIAVFQSPTESIEQFILKSRDMTKTEFPFTLLSDPEQKTYAQYKVGRSRIGRVRGVANACRSKECRFYARKHSREHGNKIEGPVDRLPSDFLIDEDGVIVDCFRARAINEHIPLDRINSFLLGEKSKRSLRNVHPEEIKKESSARNKW